MLRLCSIVFASLIAAALPAGAQQDAPKPVDARKIEAKKSQEKSRKGEAAKAPKAAAPMLAIPHPNQMRILIRSSMMALNHASLTGNFTVLRDLGAPGFQSANSAGRLAGLFQTLAKRNIDLGPTAVIEPKLAKQPEIGPQGLLRLTGFFPSRPEQVNFDLAFEMVTGRWKLFGIAVSTAPSADRPVAQADNPQGAPPAPARKSEPKRLAPADDKELDWGAPTISEN